MVDPRATFETTWWELVRDDDGKIAFRERDHGVKSPLMRRMDGSGEPVLSHELPIGALWAVAVEHAGFYPKGDDGLAVVCRLADHHSWFIDGRASNCTMKEDHIHRCWVRHGTVGDRLTVDKRGPTCAAGAGSIFMGRDNEWHGYLRNGVLTP